ncbi:MAG: hypothetical protein JST70_08825 [Bacteroidetes bacterium]|nr:hypothetical protein [Bacteroidota bacterium]
MNYTVTGDHNRHFTLLHNEDVLGTLDYSGTFKVGVTLTIGGDEYRLGPHDIWATSYHVVNGSDVIADLKLSWGGSHVIELGGTKYRFSADFWNRIYTLYSSDEQQMAVMNSEFNWSSLSLLYKIETNDYYPEANNVLLLLILIYCCNHMKRHVATEPV